MSAMSPVTAMSPMTVEAALAAGATLVAAAFTCSTTERWLTRRPPHLGCWSISLAMFTVASGALWLGASGGWNLPTFTVFYLFGAILNVPWLALGTVHLLAPAHVARRCTWSLAVLSGFAAGMLAVAPTHAAVAGSALPKGREVFGVLPRVFAAVGSGGAALVLIGGALWSAWRVARGRRRSATAAEVRGPGAGRLAWGNVLIATGTLVLSASGSLNARLGEMQAFAVTLLVGVVVLFAGFLVASSGSTAPVSPGRRLAVALDAAGRA
jgi:hypothetical protein